jgi:hypothetical protein
MDEGMERREEERGRRSEWVFLIGRHEMTIVVLFFL